MNEAIVSFLTALNKVQGIIEPVKVDSENTHFHSRYASLASVNDTVMGPLTENGFVLLQGGAEIGGKPYLRTTLYHVGGHSVSFDYPLTVSDNPQHVASSMTYARRISICALLALSTEDDDAEAVSSPARAHQAATAAARPSNVPSRAPEDKGFEVARFVPSRVDFVEGKGKGAGKTFCEVYRADGAKFSGTEQQGEIAEAARTSKKEIIVAFERKGNYLNMKRDGVKMADGVTSSPVEDVAF